MHKILTFTQKKNNNTKENKKKLLFLFGAPTFSLASLNFAHTLLLLLKLYDFFSSIKKRILYSVTKSVKDY
jgi:hypothetical protein